ncbi:MAG: hypothetical protein JXR83_17635 [Deltaproteobacteria bacterium]|nr:hypothetical protein [Deltaproteobacteria bacterium]
MKTQLTMATGFLVLVLAACPPVDQADAGVSDARGPDHAGSDHRAPDQAAPDAAVADAAIADTATTDAGPGSDRIGLDQASGDAASCTPPAFTACDGIAASNNPYTLITLGTPGIGGSHVFSIGATRGEVVTAMGGATETPAPFSDFAVVYCSEGLVLYFADDLSGTAAHKGELSETDRLYKITAFGNFAGHTDTTPQLALGDGATAVANAFGSADFTGTGSSVAGAEGEYRFWYAGHSVLLNGGAVETLSVHAPQSPTGTIDTALSFADGTIGSVSISHNVIVVPVPTGSSLAAIRTAFGAAPEADGDLTVTVGSVPVNLLVLSYSVLGLRFSGPATQAIAGDDRKVYTAIVSAPFQGQDSDGQPAIGIGSSRAEIESRFGAGTADAPDSEGRVLHRYSTGSRKTGVYYIQDQSCVERAVMFIVNLIES